MKRIEIPANEFNLNVVKAWGEDWFLLTAGRNEPGEFNTMTVAWGSFGVMWGKPFAQVVVRPQRYTRKFMDDGDSFTLCAFAEEYRDALTLCGTKSGRDLDKAAEAGLTPVASTKVSAPGFAQARLIIECRKTYRDRFNPDHFLNGEIPEGYEQGDFHYVYFGDILAIHGVSEYRKS